MAAQAALTFDNTATRSGGIGASAFELTPSGGNPPYTFSYSPTAGNPIIPGFQVVNSPNVPVSFTAAQTGALIGIPSGASHTSVTSYTTSIRLTDSTAAFVDKSVTVTITPLDFAGNVAKNLGVGDVANMQFVPVDGTAPYTFSISGTPPPGLTLNASTGLLSGTLTTAGSYPFTVKLTDSLSPTPISASHDFTMVVNPLRITNATNRILPSGTINTAYSFQLTASGGTPPYAFTIASGSSIPSGLTLSSGGLINGTPSNSSYSSETQIVVTDSSNPANSNTLHMAINILPTSPTPLGLTTATLTDVMLGDNALSGVTASGGVPPYSFDVAPGSSLPAGALFQNGYNISADTDPDRGFIRSRIHIPGTYSFILRVTDSAGSQATRPYTLHASQIGFWYLSVPVSSSAATPMLGSPYSAYLIALGGTGPYTVTPMNVPAGVSVDNTGFLSGAPQESGSALPLYLTLADSASNTYNSSGTMTVNSTTATALFCNGGTLGTAQLGNEYSDNIICTGSPQNPPVFGAAVVSGSLPPGLILLAGNGLNNGGNLNVAAQLAGVASQTGNYAFTIKVIDGLGDVGQRQIRLHVSGLAIVNADIASGSLNTAYIQTLDVRGGTPPYAFTTVGSLPTGLSIDPAVGTISGTPTTTGSDPIAVRVTDSTGDNFTRNYTLNIYAVIIGNANVVPYAVYGQPYSQTLSASPAASYT